jgi:Kef-type K+ transport system membrane component KefB
MTHLSRWYGKRFIPVMAGFGLMLPVIVFGSGGDDVGHAKVGGTFLAIAALLVAAKVSSLVERWKQPAVLGELIIGVVLGNLALVGFTLFEPIKTNEVIQFLAELGVGILLFIIGLESNIDKMRQVGVRALLVATVGVIAPFVLGTWVVGPLLLPDLDSNTYLFLGAALTATSVGITARVFKDLGRMHTPEAQIVLGAAVIDDVMGLIILAVVSAIVTVGAISVGAISLIAGKAILFLVGAIVLGRLLAPRLGWLFSRIHTGTGMKLTLAFSFFLVMAYLAEKIGLAPIVGAFAAGLVLDPVHFKHFEDPAIVKDMLHVARNADNEVQTKMQETIRHHAHRHIEDLLEPLSVVFVPIFFVVTGMNVNLEALFNPKIIVAALAITALAFVTKIIAGLAAGPVKKWHVGWGMVPRGEVGLIFAAIGRQLGVINEELFSIVVIMVILTTLLTPPILAALLRRQQPENSTLSGTKNV